MANDYSLTVAAASSEYLEKTTTAGMWSGSSAFTMECWIKASLASELAVISRGSQNSNNGITMQANVNLLGIRIEGGNIFFTASGIHNGSWHHLAIVYNGGGGIVGRTSAYLDGVSLSVSSSSDGTPAIPVNARARIGANCDTTPSNFFDGQIDDVRYWNVARSQAEIQANMSSELVGNETNLCAYYKLNNNPTDATANSNTMTENNTPTYTTDVPFVGASAAVRKRLSLLGVA